MPSMVPAIMLTSLYILEVFIGQIGINSLQRESSGGLHGGDLHIFEHLRDGLVGPNSGQALERLTVTLLSPWAMFPDGVTSADWHICGPVDAYEPEAALCQGRIALYIVMRRLIAYPINYDGTPEKFAMPIFRQNLLSTLVHASRSMVLDAHRALAAGESITITSDRTSCQVASCAD